jgi:hypothetical protein
VRRPRAAASLHAWPLTHRARARAAVGVASLSVAGLQTQKGHEVVPTVTVDVHLPAWWDARSAPDAPPDAPRTYVDLAEHGCDALDGDVCSYLQRHYARVTGTLADAAPPAGGYAAALDARFEALPGWTDGTAHNEALARKLLDVCVLCRCVLCCLAALALSCALALPRRLKPRSPKLIKLVLHYAGPDKEAFKEFVSNTTGECLTESTVFVDVYSAVSHLHKLCVGAVLRHMRLSLSLMRSSVRRLGKEVTGSVRKSLQAMTHALVSCEAHQGTRHGSLEFAGKRSYVHSAKEDACILSLLSGVMFVPFAQPVRGAPALPASPARRARAGWMRQQPSARSPARQRTLPHRRKRLRLPRKTLFRPWMRRRRARTRRTRRLLPRRAPPWLRRRAAPRGRAQAARSRRRRRRVRAHRRRRRRSSWSARRRRCLKRRLPRLKRLSSSLWRRRT